MGRQAVVYILASKQNGTLYIGVTSDLAKRAWIHKNDLIEGFTKKYAVHRLVYYEVHPIDVRDCQREAIEKMEQGMEVGINRVQESRLERPVG